MATYTLLTHPFQWHPTVRIPKSRTHSSSFLHSTRVGITSHSSTINTKTLQTLPFQVRSSASHAYSTSIFDEDNQKKYYILGGKGGVGKTTSTASLAVKFADHGHRTFLISFDPNHSLSDCFDQDLTKGAHILGLKIPLFAWEAKGTLEGLNVDIKDYMDVLGLGNFGESKFENVSASLHEAILIWNVMFMLDTPEYSDVRVVFDTSIMDGSLLNLLCNPDNSDSPMAFINPAKTAMVRESTKKMKRAGELIRGSTEYVITTIATVMAVKESVKLHALLKKEKVYVRRLIVNRILTPSSTRFCSMKTEDELRTLKMIHKDPELSSLEIIEAPLVDWEMKGIPALKLMGDIIWK